MKTVKVHGIKMVAKAEEVVRYLFITKPVDVMNKYTLLKFVNNKKMSDMKMGECEVKAPNPCRMEEIITCNPKTTYLEVQASDLPYLVKPEGDWEFRKPELTYRSYINDSSDLYICPNYVEGGHGTLVTAYIQVNGDFLSGFRWCKPREVEPVNVGLSISMDVTCPHCSEEIDIAQAENLDAVFKSVTISDWRKNLCGDEFTCTKCGKTFTLGEIEW